MTIDTDRAPADGDHSPPITTPEPPLPVSDVEFLDDDSLAQSLRVYHWVMLFLAAGVILAAFLLQVRSDQRVEFRFAPGYPLPESCHARKFLNQDCPGCGLTRSFIYLAEGNLSASRAVQPLGWLLALITLAQLPYRLWAIRHPSARPLGTVLPLALLIGLVVLLWARWASEILWQWNGI